VDRTSGRAAPRPRSEGSVRDKLWMTLQRLGRAGVAALVGRHVSLARRLAAAVDAAPDLEPATPAELSVACFRYAPPRFPGGAARLDALDKALAERIQAEGRAFLTGTALRGRYALRALRPPRRHHGGRRRRPGEHGARSRSGPHPRQLTGRATRLYTRPGRRGR